MKRILFALICALDAFAGACSAREIAGYTPDEVVTYKQIGNTKLTIDIFYPENHRESDAKAAIVFFYAGGWAQGQGHGFYNHMNPGFSATVIETDEFFVSLGHLFGRPDPKALNRIEAQGKEVEKKKSSSKSLRFPSEVKSGDRTERRK